MAAADDRRLDADEVKGLLRSHDERPPALGPASRFVPVVVVTTGALLRSRRPPIPTKPARENPWSTR